MALPSAIQSLLEALDEPALLVSGGQVAAANSAARQLLGRDVEGRDLRLAIRQPDALRLIQSGAAGQIETSGIGAADRPWQVSVRPLSGSSLLVRLIDRSPTRAAEKMRVDFVANASHELRTPLTTILGYSETLADDGEFDPATRARFASTIRDEARRMLRIIEDLMSLSRIEADRFVAPGETVPIDEVIQLAGSHGRELANRRDCRIEVEAGDDLPRVRGDFGQLLQMTDNLVANAIRYGCPDKGCTIRIRAERTDGEVALSVTDEGEGIESQHLPRLTERFYRVDATRSRDSGGTGLGLAIVKHIVERHRGRLEIRSRPGRGTEVRVRLPVV